MRKALMTLIGVGVTLIALCGAVIPQAATQRDDDAMAKNVTAEPAVVTSESFDVDVIVNGRPLEEYAARGRRYVEALRGAEYELRIRNPSGARVAVALSVDGLNTIDARRTTAWNASKWVIGPYQTITVSGWQMSSARARRFYFTSERDSYGAKLGQTSHLGVISAVFFSERQPVPIPVVPPPPRPPREDRTGREESKQRAPEALSSDRAGAKPNNAEIYPAPDEDYAATGIGRDVRHDVRWVSMDLQPRPVAEVTIRYEYHEALVRLGILPRPAPRPEPLHRRERAKGFEDGRYCPEP
ncbi:MAG TPA: hypothetical protein VD966_05620 [Pyrinomonadaceae bacterium]|nr:hypothetical protein [Pyrinomonadaceae bacterium]